MNVNDLVKWFFAIMATALVSFMAWVAVTLNDQSNSITELKVKVEGVLELKTQLSDTQKKQNEFSERLLRLELKVQNNA